MLGHYAGPRWLNSGPVFNLIGGTAVVALIVGARKNLQAQRGPWYLFALAQALFVIGDVLAYNYQRLFGSPLPFPSIADAFYLAVGPLLVAGLVLLVRGRNRSRSRASLIDALIMTAAAAALSWIYLMAPYAHDHALTLATKLTSIAYPMMDIMVLAVVLRLAVGGRGRGASFGFLLAGASMLLLTDTVYGWKLIHGGYSTGGVLDLGWAAFYALLGAAALHPSVRQLADPAPDPGERLTRSRLALLTCATLTAPTLLLTSGSLVNSFDGTVLVATSVLLFALVLVRMTGLVRRNEEAVRREAALRKAGESLVQAIDCEEIYLAAIQAAQSVLGGNAVARLYVAGDATDRLAAVGSSEEDLGSLPPLSLEDLARDARADLMDRRVVNLVERSVTVSLAPLLIGGQITGVLSVSTATRPTASAEQSLATLATEVGLALQSARLTEEAQDRRSEARLSSLVQSASDVICIVGKDAHIHYISPSVKRMFGYDPNSLAEGRFVDVVHPDERELVLAFLAAIAAQPAAGPQKADFQMRHAEQGWREVEALGTNLLDDEAVEGIVLNIRDITERKVFEAELEHQAFHDSLTGLPNRALFRDRLQQALAGQGRSSSSVAVLFLDVDALKDVNDNLGHSAGDALLLETGRRLDDCLRSTDTAARVGGDEFAVMIPGPESEMEKIEIAERVSMSLSFSLTLEGRQVAVATSMGIAFSDSKGSFSRNADELLRDADAAMYSAKRSGKGGYQVFQPEMHAKALARLELKSDLQRAMNAHEFTLRYQPIIDLANGEMRGMESLVRWEHPTHGVVAPVEFIPLFEETGLIVALGRQILEDACHHAVLIQRECPHAPPLSISVNVSAFQLRRPEFIDEVRSVLEETQIPPNSLVLELTESVMMDDIDLSIARMNSLHELGVRLAIDDFGSGYSSLMYLRRLPVDILKIDRSFLADPSAEAKLLIVAIVQLAQIFKLRTVVEGVEDETYIKRLQETHCDYGQGFHFAKPLSAEDVMALAIRQSTMGRPDGAPAGPVPDRRLDGRVPV